MTQTVQGAVMLTTEEAIRRLFPPPVIEAVKQATTDTEATEISITEDDEAG
jgi:hypothetical protein